MGDAEGPLNDMSEVEPGTTFYPEVVESRSVHRGKVINLRLDRITTPRGGIVDREVVEHRGAVVMIAVDEDEQVFFVRQYRHAVGRYLLELPAGGLEAGEEPLAAAKRELREEVGLEADDWTSLGSFYSSPGFASERLYVFLARHLVTVPRDPDDDEDLVVVRYPLREVLPPLLEAADCKTLAAFYLLEHVAAGSRYITS